MSAEDANPLSILIKSCEERCNTKLVLSEITTDLKVKFKSADGKKTVIYDVNTNELEVTENDAAGVPDYEDIAVDSPSKTHHSG